MRVASPPKLRGSPSHSRRSRCVPPIVPKNAGVGVGGGPTLLRGTRRRLVWSAITRLERREVEQVNIVVVVEVRRATFGQ